MIEFMTAGPDQYKVMIDPTMVVAVVTNTHHKTAEIYVGGCTCFKVEDPDGTAAREISKWKVKR